MTTVAVMQPYFFPYGGYYRLLAAADVFVIFDCVQFPRRGWVHRNRLPLANGVLDWLTLPLRKADYHASIADLRFADYACDEFLRRCQRFPVLRQALCERSDEALVAALVALDGTVVDYLESMLKLAADLLGFSPRFHRSSHLELPAEIRGPNRVAAIAKAFGATDYVNLSGGIDYYDAKLFAGIGARLHVLQDYEGDRTSMLARLLMEDPAVLRTEILAQLRYYQPENEPSVGSHSSC